MISAAIPKLRRALLAGFAFATLVMSGSPETDAILRLLPPDTAACLVFEDLAEYSERAANSQLLARFEQLDVVQNWKQSPVHRSLEVAVASLPIYFGISNDRLIREVFGESVVFAYIPPNGDHPAAGIFACHASDELTLKSVFERVSKPNPNREVRVHEYRGVTFVERTEFGTRHDCILRLGPVVLVGDKPASMQQVIDISLDGGGLYESRVFQAMRSAIGDGAFAQLWLDTRALLPLLQQAVAETGPFAVLLEHVWSNVDWAAVSLRIGDPIELSAYASLGRGESAERVRSWARVLSRPNAFWKRVPAAALAAAATDLDFQSLARVLEIVSRKLPEFRDLLTTAKEMVVGFDVEKEVLARLGPEVGIVAIRDESGELHVTAEIELRSSENESPTVLPLAETLELVVLRPLLVLYTVDHNRLFEESVRVETHSENGVRLHAMTRSELLPSWLRPCFVVRPDRVSFGSSPEAIRSRQSSIEEPFESSGDFRRFRKAIGTDAVLKAYLSVRRLRDYLNSNRTELAGQISRQRVESKEQVAQKLDQFTSVLSLFEFVTLSTSQRDDVLSWTLSAFPTNDLP